MSSRVNPKPDESLVGRAFLRDRLVVVASPDIARPKGDRIVPAVVRGVADQATSWDLKAAKGSSRIAVEPILRMSSMIMLRDAVRVGAGVRRLPISLVSHDIAAGKLVPRAISTVPKIALWTLYPSRRLLSARVSAFLEHLKRAFPKGTPDEARGIRFRNNDPRDASGSAEMPEDILHADVHIALHCVPTKSVSGVAAAVTLVISVRRRAIPSGTSRAFRPYINLSATKRRARTDARRTVAATIRCRARLVSTINIWRRPP